MVYLLASVSNSARPTCNSRAAPGLATLTRSDPDWLNAVYVLNDVYVSKQLQGWDAVCLTHAGRVHVTGISKCTKSVVMYAMLLFKLVTGKFSMREIARNWCCDA
jgi:hypothetical protein